MPNAGEKLRADMAAALVREAVATGRSGLTFDEVELAHLDAAALAADAVEVLSGRIGLAEADPKTSPADLVKLLSERRQQSARLTEAVRWLAARLPNALGGTPDPQRALAGRSRRTGRPGNA